MVITPRPPRFLVGYSEATVHLPKPCSHTVSISSSLRWATVSMLTTSSPSRSWMPFTPRAVRPMIRTCSSWNRMDCPDCVPRMMSCSPSVTRTLMRESPSLKLVAMIPVERTLAKAMSSVRLTSPWRVANTTYRWSVNSGMERRFTTFSSCSSSTFTRALPRDAGPPEGIS